MFVTVRFTTVVSLTIDGEMVIVGVVVLSDVVCDTRLSAKCAEHSERYFDVPLMLLPASSSGFAVVEDERRGLTLSRNAEPVSQYSCSAMGPVQLQCRRE